MSSEPEITLSIERLVVHGVPAAAQRPLTRAFHRELQRLLAADYAAGAWRDAAPGVLRPALDLQVTASGSPSDLGRQLARAIQKALHTP